MVETNSSNRLTATLSGLRDAVQRLADVLDAGLTQTERDRMDRELYRISETLTQLWAMMHSGFDS